MGNTRRAGVGVLGLEDCIDIGFQLWFQQSLLGKVGADQVGECASDGLSRIATDESRGGRSND